MKKKIIYILHNLNRYLPTNFGKILSNSADWLHNFRNFLKNLVGKDIIVKVTVLEILKKF